MNRLRALVVAAGSGSRSGLAYPKTLFPVQGKPILVRLLEALSGIEGAPTVVVSLAGREMVATCLAEHGATAHLVVQPSPSGMGDAVLRFMDSPAFAEAEHVALAWGDLAFLQPQTVARTIEAHRKGGNDFTFPTRQVDSPYTVVGRDERGGVTEVVETRESGITPPPTGERDIGFFVFRKEPVFRLLGEERPGKRGARTGEHGFLYVVRHLVAAGFRVEALAIATAEDLVSFNAPADIERYA